MTDKELLLLVNNSLRQNMGKAIITLFLVYLGTSLLGSSILLFSSIGGSIIIMSLMGFCVTTIFFMLYLGYVILLAKLYRGDRAIIGDIFFVFKHGKGTVSHSIFLSITFLLIAFVVLGLGSFFVFQNIVPHEHFSVEKMLSKLMEIYSILVFFCFLIFSLLVILPTAFVHLVFLDNPDISLMDAYKENNNLLKGQKLHLFVLSLKVGGKWLVGTVVTFLLNMVIVVLLRASVITIPESMTTFLLLFVNILDIIFFICSYTTIIRIGTGIAAFYESIKPLDFSPFKVENIIQIPEN